MLEAKTKLSQLVEAAERGEDVVIARNGVAVAQIVPVRKRKFTFGFLKGQVPPVSDALLFAIVKRKRRALLTVRDKLLLDTHIVVWMATRSRPNPFGDPGGHRSS